MAYMSEWAGTQPAVFHLGQLKNRRGQNFFFDIVTTQNDHPTYGKHVLGNIYVFFHLIWLLGAEQQGKEH